MNNDKTIQDIKTISKIISVILKICQITCYIGMGIAAAALIYGAINGGLTDVVLNEHVTIKAPVSKEWLAELSFSEIAMNCVFVIIKLGLYQAAFIFAQKIFDDVRKHDTPFEIQHVKRMRIIAVLLLVAGTITFSENGSGMTFALDAAGLAGPFIIWGLSYVFDYGCRLQKESDETL